MHFILKKGLKLISNNQAKPRYAEADGVARGAPANALGGGIVIDDANCCAGAMRKPGAATPGFGTGTRDMDGDGAVELAALAAFAFATAAPKRPLGAAELIAP